MTTEQMMLSMLLKSTYSCQSDIHRAMDAASSTGLKGILASQQLELDAIEGEAQALVCRRGWELNLPQQGASFQLRLHFPNSDCRIAERLIERQTRAMIHLLKFRHQYEMQDIQTDCLLQKLVDCHLANIRKLLRFL